MNTQQIQRTETGFVLIEALVSLIVVAVGVLGIAKLNSVLLQGTGLSKARAEAIEIAQDRVEQARNYELNTGDPDTNPCGVAGAFADSTTTVTGKNASYTVATTYPSGSGTGWRSINVCVTWDGGSCDLTLNTLPQSNRVVLRSVLTCDGMGTSAQVGKNGASGVAGGFVKTPTGRAQIGGANATAGSGSQNQISTDGINANDGTRTYTATDGTLQLLDANGTALLSVKKLDCETSAPAFSTVTGKVIVEAKNGAPIAAASDLFILSSDAAYCTKLSNSSYSNYYGVMPTGATGNAIKYFYTYYQCYVGAYWWGNIGVVRTDNANTNERVCVGNPNPYPTSSTIFKKTPQINTTRAYRGYRDLGNGLYETKGIGEQETNSTACSTGSVTVKEYVPQRLEQHHFVHLTLTGSASDSDCTTPETTLNTYSPANSLGTASANTASTSSGVRTVVATNNPGKYYCMSNEDGVTCPDLVANPTPPTTLLHGTITNTTGLANALTGIDDTSSINSCTSQSLTANGSSSYTYSCQINWTGFTASSWTGAIPFVASGTATLCSNNSTPTVVPSGQSVTVSVNPSNATTNPNSINFGQIPTSVTDITLNFDVKASVGACTTLAQPFPTWSSTGNGSNTVYTLSWPAITGATGYRVRTCSGSLTCTPSGSGTQTGTTYTAPSTGDYQMCFDVTATDGTNFGTTSSIKCLKKNNNTYTPS